MMFVLALLALNTIFCIVDTLLKRAEKKSLALWLPPQIMHLGVLFIMLGHLLTASVGFKTDLALNRGEQKNITASSALTLKNAQLLTDTDGYVYDWSGIVAWTESGKDVGEKVVRPAHPVFFGQYGIYIKSVSTDPLPSVQLRVCKDPGAPWALIGGLLLSAGGLGFLYGRFIA